MKDMIEDLFKGQDVMKGAKTFLMHDVTKEKCYKEVQDQLNRYFTMNELKEIAKLIRSVVVGCKICDAKHPDKLLSSMYAPGRGIKYKADYLCYLAGFFASADNLRTLFSMFDAPTQRMWKYLFIYHYSTFSELEKQTGTKWFAESSRYSYWDNSVSSFHLACCMMDVNRQGYYSSGQRYVCLNDFFWNIYKSNLLPDLHDGCLEGTDTLPQDTVWQVYSNEQEVGNQIQMIGQLVQQKAVSFGDKKMTATEVKKLDKQLCIPEFFPDTTDNQQKFLAASLAIPLLSLFLNSYKKNLTEYHKALKELTLADSKRYVLFDMLSHLKGLKRDDILDYANYDEHENLLQDSLSTLEPGKWYSFGQVQKGMYASVEATARSLSVFSTGIVYRSNIVKHDGKLMSPADFYDEVQCPVTCGYLALYAACGLLDVAYCNDVRGIGAYSFIKYVRLTSLGAYVLGKTDIFKPVGIHDPIEYFETDPDRLIIFCRQIDGKNPYEGLLSNIAEKISENRYLVTPKSWLHGCSKATDLANKQSFFCKNVCKEASDTWLHFFDEMLKRCNPLKQTQEQYIIRQLDPSNKELLALFSTDSYLRKHSLRGENFTILIERRFMEKVEDRLRSYGYLV